jgi:hypothetical protein
LNTQGIFNMYNSDTPARVELPSSKQLLRSTILAAISALVLLVAVVLPAEYGIDPTGVGRALRLTEMGEVKQQLAAEAAVDAAGGPAAASTETEASVFPNANAAQTATKPVPENSASSPVPLAVPKVAWRDEIPFTLTPGEGTEIKLKMVAGAKAQYAWVVKGGAVNFDTHGDAPGKSISYEKGRGVASDEGVLEAAFTGNHGWYWRNRGQSDVQLVLRTRGDYSEIKQ